MNKKILILGKNGLLGAELAGVFAGADCTSLDRDDLDITNSQRLSEKLDELKPDMVINSTGYTAVDDAEEDFDTANKINGEAVGVLAKWCNENDAILVHFSTDYIFHGDKQEGYNESDIEFGPLNKYGESKLLGEQLLLRNCQKYYLIRTSWLFGKNGPNFVDTMMRLGKERDELSIVNDQIGKPTFAKDLAMRVKEITLDDPKDFGIYHIANEPACSWYEFAKNIFQIAKNPVSIRPVSSEEFPRPAKRPHFSILNNNKLEPLRSWREALEEYINE